MKKLVVGAICALIAAVPSLASACTTWAVAGTSAAGGGTIVAKNRDWVPDNNMTLKVVEPGNGLHKYLSLEAVGGDEPGCKGGVNDAGLTVLTESAPQYLHSIVYRPAGTKRNSWLLSHFGGVEEAIAALKHGDWVTIPQFIVLSDATAVGYVEMGANGEYAVRTTTNGTLGHTNHYLLPEMLKFNSPNPGKSSLRRIDKACTQLAGKSIFTLDDIKGFTADPVVWRAPEPGRPDAVQTLASLVVRNAPNRGITIWLKIANPGASKVYEAQFTLDDAFVGKATLPQ